MSHELDTSNNRVNMAWVGKTPWHGLGEELKQGASIEQWKKAAGMNFTVEKSPVLYEVAGEYYEDENRVVMYRDDTSASFGVVSHRYKPVQPGEVLEFYRDLVEENDMTLETAGCLKGGAVYWALAKTGDSFKVHGSSRDQVDAYVLLATSNDGHMATKAKFTSVRVVCNNTLSMAGFYRRGKAPEGEVRIPHITEFDHEKVKQQLGLSHQVFDEFSTLIDEMADHGMSKKQNIQLLSDLYYPKRDKKKDDDAKLRHVYATLELVENSPGANYKSAQGTLWGTINGVTAYLDHARKSRTDDARLRSAWFGTGETLKRELWNMALKQIKRDKVPVAA